MEWKGKQGALALYQLPPGTTDEWHEHGDFFQVSISLVGRSRIEQGSETRWLDHDLRAVTSPGEKHRNVAEEESIRLLLFSMRREFLERVYQDVTGDEQPLFDFQPWVEGSSEVLKRQANHALAKMAVQPLETLESDEMEWRWAELFLTLHLGTHSDRWMQGHVRRAWNPVVKRVMDYFQDSYASEVSLEKVLAISGVSKTHLFRLFQEELGSSPGEALQRIRLRRAEEMLRGTDMRVTEVAFATGFGSLSTFERALKRAYGKSAGAIRRSRDMR